ncbi:hypothetical protein E2C01_005665 [Portunus trituberculatus]|uniref:Uncharacterized protein n=1 Tax=Portunus trituberculatus TaxID=210409 RepID=A0A5B7CUW2_PORTR|nr:hypothetical protein [Portunus trituberculatus]
MDVAQCTFYKCTPLTEKKGYQMSGYPFNEFGMSGYETANGRRRTRELIEEKIGLAISVPATSTHELYMYTISHVAIHPITPSTFHVDMFFPTKAQRRPSGCAEY